jgi:hypothetical protein
MKTYRGSQAKVEGWSAENQSCVKDIPTYVSPAIDEDRSGTNGGDIRAEIIIRTIAAVGSRRKAAPNRPV